MWDELDGFQMALNPGASYAPRGQTMSSMMRYTPAPVSTPAPVGGTSTPGNWFSDLFGSGEGGMFSRQGMFGGMDRNTGIATAGWAPTALGIGQAFLGARQGQQALDLANKQFGESKRQFDLNFGAQRQSINTQLEDRQRARVASNPGAYEDVDSYMKKNKV